MRVLEAPDTREFAYCVDAADRITSVNKPWGEFAAENNASELLPDAVRGRPLWDFIANPEVRRLYEVLFRKVRKTRKPVTIPFRCDSPSRRRFMQLVVSPGLGDELEIVSRIIREDKRNTVALLDLAQPRSNKTLEICSWCKLVRLTDRHWVEVEVALDLLGTSLGPTWPQLVQGICPECRTQLLAS
jgi:hypothetical protein